MYFNYNNSGNNNNKLIIDEVTTLFMELPHFISTTVQDITWSNISVNRTSIFSVLHRIYI